MHCVNWKHWAWLNTINGALFFVVILLSSINSMGQTPGLQNKGPINIFAELDSSFENLPNIYLGEIVNTGGGFDSLTKKIHLNDLKTRIIILDFWMAYCSGCIEKFPHLEKLQEKYKNDITILPIGFSKKLSTGEISGSIKNRVMSWRGTFRQMRMPSTEIIEADEKCSEIRKLFPFHSVPTLVWIKNGKLLGVTDGKLLNENIIESVIDDKITKLKSRSVQEFMDRTIPFLLNTDVNRINHIYGISFSGYFDSLRTQFLTIDTTQENILRVFAVNNSVMGLYTHLLKLKYGQWAANSKRYIIEAKKIGNYLNIELNGDGFFSFDMQLPSNQFSLKSAINYLSQEVNRYLNVNVVVENRKVKVYVLKECSFYKEDYNLGNTSFYESSNGELNFINYPAESFVAFINSFLGDRKSPLVISGLTKRKSISTVLKFDKKSIEEINKALIKDCLILREETVEMDMIIIKNRNNKE